MTSTLTMLGAEPNEAPKDELSALSIGVKQPDDDDTAPVVENTDQAVLHDNNNATAATADDIKREPESASTAPYKTDMPPLPPPNALDLIAIVDQFRAALRPLEEILKQHGARMSTVEFDATVDLVADMRKSLAALELSLTDTTTTTSVCEPSADSKHAPPTVPSQHLRDTQATAFQRIFRVTGMCAEVYRATKQFEIVNAARRVFADRVEQQNRALASSFGLDLDAIKADALASSAEAKPADAMIPRD